MLSDLVSVIMSTVDPLQGRTQTALKLLAKSTIPYELILLNRNYEWTTGSIINQGIAASVGGYVAFCCDDCFIEPDALEEMRKVLQDPETGVVGALLQYPDGIVQHAGGYVYVGNKEDESGRKWVDLKHIGQGEPIKDYKTGDVDFVTGAFMMTRSDVLQTIGWYASDCELCWGDVDFCFRARKSGYRVQLVATARAIHLEASTRGKAGEPDRANVSWFLSRGEDSEFVVPPDTENKDLQPTLAVSVESQ